MKILLINPPYNIKEYMGNLSKVAFTFPPVGLMALAAYAREKGHRVKILDFHVEHLDIFQEIKDSRPDVVGITCQTALVYSTIDLAKLIKERFPDTKIIVGGIHPSIRPLDLLKEPEIDAVVVGEGELTLEELLNLFQKNPNPTIDELSQIDGVAFLDNNGNIVKTKKRALISDINILPMPAYDLVDFNNYRPSPDLKMGTRLGVISTSRGCPYHCIFCADRIIFEGRYRAKSLDNVFKEIEYFVSHYDINQLIIYDDNFIVKKDRTVKFCKRFIEKGYHKKINFWIESRVDSFDREIIEQLRNAGCKMISMGIESGVQRILDMMHKNVSLDQVVKGVNLIHDVGGIAARGSFIIGFPTETTEESKETIRFAYNLPLDFVRFAIATPFPGTELWNIAVKEGKIDPENIRWTDLSLMAGYTDHDPLYYPEGRTPKELVRLQRYANFRFYLKPKVIWNLLKTKSLNDIFSGFMALATSTLGKDFRKI